jgi:hypothetical protein
MPEPPRPGAAKPAALGEPQQKPRIKGELRLTGESIELNDLLQFRERLEQMTRELVDEFSRIISLRPVSSEQDSDTRS